MKLKGAGVSIMSLDVVGHPDRLEDKLNQICKAGFQAAELPIQGMKTIVNGEIDEARLETYRALLARFPLAYSLHAPFDLNLFRPALPLLEQQLFMAALEVTGRLGAKVMVYHVGRYVGEEQLIYPHTWAPYSETEKEGLLRMEADFMRRAGERAERFGVRIGMENVRPYLDCPDYCYSVFPAELARQVAAIGHPNVGIALDVGHLHLSVCMHGLDLERELEAVAPHVMHLHVHDNYGRPNFSTEKNQYELLALGRGDMHMPIGRGTVPMARIAAMLEGRFEGYLIHEVRHEYEAAWPTLAIGTYRSQPAGNDVLKLG